MTAVSQNMQIADVSLARVWYFLLLGRMSFLLVFSLEYNKILSDKNRLKRENNAEVILKTSRFGDIDSAVIISSVSTKQAVSVLIILMITAESMLSKRVVLRIVVEHLLEYRDGY